MEPITTISAKTFAMWVSIVSPCEYEDSEYCHWQANVHGNLSGVSFVDTGRDWPERTLYLEATGDQLALVLKWDDDGYIWRTARLAWFGDGCEDEATRLSRSFHYIRAHCEEG